MKRILWLINFLPPVMAKALSLPVQASGSWVMALEQALRTHTQLQDIQLFVAAYHPAVSSIQRHTAEGTTYIALPKAQGFSALQEVLQTLQPNLIQLFGTENEHALWLTEHWNPERIVIHIQGLAGPYAHHAADGLPSRFLRSQPLKEWLSAKTGGKTVRQLVQQLEWQGKRERQVLEQVGHVLGRTQWDKDYAQQCNPSINYHHLDEIMRESFYHTQWKPCQNPHPVLFVTQGNLPLKGLHRLVEALPKLLSVYPNLQVKVAGWPPVRKHWLLQPLVRWLCEYQTYLEERAKALGVEGHIHYTGVLDQQGVRQALLSSDVFLMPSSIENSPNSLGEAMLMGMPCVACKVGGIPSMLTHGKEGFLFDSDSPDQLAEQVLWMLQNTDKAVALGQAARTRALVTHDPSRIAHQQVELYHELLDF